MAEFFYDQEDILKKIIQNLRKSKSEADQLEVRKNDEDPNGMSNLKVPGKK